MLVLVFWERKILEIPVMSFAGCIEGTGWNEMEMNPRYRRDE